MSFAMRVLHRAGSLAYLSILLLILAAMLFDSFSLLLPRQHWTAWRVPVLIAKGPSRVN